MALALLALCTVALADDPIAYLVRISLAEGEVSYQRANDPKSDWFDVTSNTPLDQNDQIYTGSTGRAEIELLGRNVARISHDTHLSLTKLDAGTMQFALSVGTATFRVASLDRRQFQVVDASQAGNNDPVYFEVDTPTIAVTLLKEGEYRINVKENGATEVIVRDGQAEVYNQDLGTIAVKQGKSILVDGSNPSVYQMQVARADSRDAWDLWNEDRDRLMPASVASSQYVPGWIPGSSDLDRYGSWWNTADYGYVWSPNDMALGWSPYQAGSWSWYPSYGWTWVSYDPWGWVPYHYGRWAFYQSRWCWLPYSGFAYSPSIWSWSPALVTFVGYDHGFHNGSHNGRYGWVGWVPLGPGEARPVRTIVAGNPAGLTPGRTTSIRSIESLRNYSAPGGLIGLDGGRFASPRVVVNKTTVVPGGRGLVASPIGDEGLRPTEKQASRRVNPVVERSLATPMVTRATRNNASGTFRPAPAETESPNVIRTTRIPDFHPAERSAPPPATRSSHGTRDRMEIRASSIPLPE